MRQISDPPYMLFCRGDERLLTGRSVSVVGTRRLSPEGKKAAREFSVAIFGEEQTEQLFDFYHGDENCVVTICGMYFGDPKNGLGKKITKAQKKNRAVIR